MFVSQRICLSPLIVVLLAMLGGCAGTGVYTQGYYGGRSTWASPPVKKPAESTVTAHTVAQGETLYSIAFQYGYDYRQVAAWNGVRAPYTIYPGQTIRFQGAGNVAVADEAVMASLPDAPNATDTNSAELKRAEPAPRIKPTTASSTTDSVQWQWPTHGKMARTFLSSEPGRRGIDLTGQFGQAVMAAASGQVVYSGSGLRGYGKLIIIKHNDTYFSAYAHNNTIYVRENETVKIGQRIADMGKDEGGQTYLHFEIRRNGVPVNPLTYLPRQKS